MTDRDYFSGCHNVPMFDDVAVEVVRPAVDAPTLADVVRYGDNPMGPNVRAMGEGVMGCLVSDAQAGSGTFHDFCADLGYDEDSRSAEATWKACQKINADLYWLFGANFDAATSHEWDR